MYPGAGTQVPPSNENPGLYITHNIHVIMTDLECSSAFQAKISIYNITVCWNLSRQANNLYAKYCYNYYNLICNKIMYTVKCKMQYMYTVELRKRLFDY